jgi:CelD/BcsL family acetyltransferase involved in cellulose biosynthesis
MKLESIQTIEQFESIAHAWNALLEDSASHVPFLRHEYLTTWWQTLGGGEWPRGELYVVTAKDAEGHQSAIAPLFFTQNREGEAALMLLGSIEISDFLDVIARVDCLESFLDELLDFLDSDQAPPWQVIDLYNILEDSPTLPLLRQVVQKRGWQYQQECLQHSPYIPLPGDWETYLAGIDKKQRHEIRRKMRRLEEAEVPTRWYIVEDENSLDAEIDDFLYLMAQDAEKQSFLTDTMRTQMRASMKAAFHAGWLQLAFLEINGGKAAGQLNFDFNNHIWVYNSGMDFKYREYSPGWVLLGYLLRWANEQGRAAYDFMRGDEDYKYRFGGVDRYVVRATVRR